LFSQDFLSVRQLLQLNERLLNKYGFFDVWRLQKLEENSKALSLLGARLEKVAAISEPRTRWETLFWGLLASNIFDSGMSGDDLFLLITQSCYRALSFFLACYPMKAQQLCKKY
jgi:hypothetical protein